jgi:outer membrane lipoprotein carrier protein
MIFLQGSMEPCKNYFHLPSFILKNHPPSTMNITSTFPILFLILLFGGLSAQDNNYSAAADSDPEARVLLEKMRSKFERYASLSASFNLAIEIPGQPTELQDGSMSQQGDQYRVELAEQAIYCDGRTIWVHLKHNNEVQINNVEEGEDTESLAPQDLLRVYEREDHVYALGNAYTRDGKPLQEIEFKPLDPDSEYAKLRLIMDSINLEPETIKVFNKDGSRYTLTIAEFTPNAKVSSEDFTFRPENFPDIFIEDLRID